MAAEPFDGWPPELVDMFTELAAIKARGGQTPVELAARCYRLERELLPEESEKRREFVHAEVAAGNVRMGQVLELLSDDPFWRAD